MNKLKSPSVMLVISMIIFGTIGLFVKKISLPSSEIALYRAVLATILIGLYLLATKQKLHIKSTKKELLLLLISGGAMGFNWIFLFESYKYTTVSAATLSYYFAPVIVTLLSPILFKEKMNFKKWLCFIMSTVGIVMITGVGSVNEKPNHTIGIAYALSAACLYASVVLLNKFIKNVDGIRRTFLQFAAAVAVLLPYVLLTDGINLPKLSAAGGINLVILGVIHSGIAYCLYFSSLKELPGQEAAILSYTDPLVAVLVSVTVLREPITSIQIFGGLLILSFTLYNEISHYKVFSSRSNK